MHHSPNQTKDCSRHIVDSDQFAPNAVAFPVGIKALLIYCAHTTPPEFRKTRLSGAGEERNRSGGVRFSGALR